MTYEPDELPDDYPFQRLYDQLERIAKAIERIADATEERL